MAVGVLPLDSISCQIGHNNCLNDFKGLILLSCRLVCWWHQGQPRNISREMFMSAFAVVDRLACCFVVVLLCGPR
jgi:hypothetical protein